jgi:hypothetical protein
LGTAFQNLWDATKAVPRVKFIALKAKIRREEKSKTNNLSFHYWNLLKIANESKVSRRKNKY